MNNSKSLVALQFIIIIILLILNDSIFNQVQTFIIALIGLFIGGYTLLFNRLGNFNIRPDIKNNAKLITTGPYKYIRHPMYLCVMIIMLSVILTDINILNLVLYAMLLVVLYKKARREELLWMQRSEAYINYMKNTTMFVPFLI